MRNLIKYAVLFSMGAIIYSLLEILWRGFTHWTMALAGGTCLSGIYRFNHRHPKVKLWLKCLYGCILITFVEFTTGVIVNRIFRLGVWDYSERFLNIMGQVCPLYSIFWFFLCIPAYLICELLRSKVFKRW